MPQPVSETVTQTSPPSCRRTTLICPPGGTVTLAERRTEEGVVVRVSDTGCGMDEQTQAHIFDKFYKGAAQQSPGNGLGLAIVRRAVELCGGSIRVASSPGCGSSFFVTLPSADG